jgi:hypothetical protein
VTKNKEGQRLTCGEKSKHFKVFDYLFERKFLCSFAGVQKTLQNSMVHIAV